MTTETDRTHHVDPRAEDRAEWPRLDTLDQLETADRLTDIELLARHADVPPRGPRTLDLTPALDLGTRVTLPKGAIGSLGVLELLRVARTLDTDLDGLRSLMAGPDAPMVTAAVAYVLALRLDPTVTWEDAQRWQVVMDTEGPAVDPTSPRRDM